MIPRGECSPEEEGEFAALCWSVRAAFETDDWASVQSYLSQLADRLTADLKFPLTHEIRATGFFTGLVSFLSCPDPTVAALSLKCLDLLSAISGSLEVALLESDVLDAVLSLLPEADFSPILLSILRNLIGSDPSISAPVADQIFARVSLEQLITLAEHDRGTYEMTMSRFLCNLTATESSLSNQRAVLRFVAQCYRSGFEGAYRANISTAMQLTTFDSFASDLFYELELNLFVDDMLGTDDPRLVYHALITVGNIYKRILPPRPSRCDLVLRAFSVGHAAVNIAAYQCLRHVVGRDADYRTAFTLDCLWRNVFQHFGDAPYKEKVFIGEFVVAYVGLMDVDVLRVMVRDGLIGIIDALLGFDTDNVAGQALLALRWLLEKFEWAGAAGFFERHAAEAVTMGRIEALAHCECEKTRAVAAIVQSKLVNLPNHLLARIGRQDDEE